VKKATLSRLRGKKLFQSHKKAKFICSLLDGSEIDAVKNERKLNYFCPTPGLSCFQLFFVDDKKIVNEKLFSRARTYSTYNLPISFNLIENCFSRPQRSATRREKNSHQQTREGLKLVKFIVREEKIRNNRHEKLFAPVGHRDANRNCSLRCHRRVRPA
jgi:hypothetical protein